MTSQNKVNTFPVASFTKSIPFNISFPASKKQPNSPWVDLSSKLANNSKLTSDKCKRHFKNNLYLYYNTVKHKLDLCSKKQTIITPKGLSASTAIDSSVAVSEKPLEK